MIIASLCLTSVIFWWLQTRLHVYKTTIEILSTVRTSSLMSVLDVSYINSERYGNTLYLMVFVCRVDFYLYSLPHSQYFNK